MGRGAKAAVAAVTTTALAAGAIALAPIAMAVSGVGPGVNGQYGHVGALHQPGVGQVYCADSSLDVPFGRGVTADYLTDYLPAWSGVAGAIDVGSDSLGRINFILSNWGQSGDPATAAAAHTATTAYLKGGGFDTAASYLGWGNQHVKDLAWSMFQQSLWIAVGSGSGSGALTFSVDHTNNYAGTVRVTGTSGTGWIELTNGIFLDSGTNKLNGAQVGRDYAIAGVPPSDGAPYKISGSGQFTGGQVWPGHVRVLEYGGGYQRTLAGVGPTTASWRVEGSDPMNRTQTFQPVLTSKTAAVTTDGVLSDELTFSLAADVNGTVNQWVKDGNGAYLPVGFKVTAYSLGADAPTEIPDAPANAVSVGSATVFAAGPDTVQSVTIPGVHPPGRYTFVAEYDPSITSSRTKMFLPQGYAWKHAYGMEAETTTVPMQVKINTQIFTDTITPGNRSDDAVTLSTDSIWLNQAGKPLEIVAYGEYIYLPASLGQIAPTETLPAGAKVLATMKLTFTKSGTKETTGLQLLSGSLNAPAVVDGSLTYRWSVRAEDNTHGLVLPFQEKIGLPEQTQTIVMPTVTTKAQTGMPGGGEAADVIIVEGEVPPAKAGKFEVFSIPYNAPLTATDLSTYCTEENRLPLDTTPIHVTKAGEYTTKPVTNVRSKIVWQEHAQFTPTGGETIVYYTAPCGLVNEITTPRPMEVSINTEILTDTITPGYRSDDAVTMSTDGVWLNHSGNPLEIVAYGEYIYLPATLEDFEPTKTMPEGAEVLATMKLTFTKEGTQETTGIELLSGSLNAPAVVDGSLTYRWSVRAEDNTHGLVLPFQEKIGLPEQTQKVVMPTVTTKAQTGMPGGGEAADVIIVEGEIPTPEAGMLEVFSIPYNAPLTATDLSTYCTEENRLPLDTTPIHVTEAGEYTTAAVTDVRSKIVWQEHAQFTPTGGETIVYYTAPCGLVNEISTPKPMEVSINTEILTDTITPGYRSDDAVTLSTDDVWLNSGNPLEIVAYGEYIYLPASLEDFEPTKTMPEEAEVLATMKLTFTEASTQDTTDIELLSGSLNAPAVVDGSLTYRWSIRAEDNTHGLVQPFQEKIGLPEQTQTIVMPTVTTKAQTGMPWGGDAADVIIVEGEIPTPEAGKLEVFSIPYKAPMTATDLSTYCTDGNRLPLDTTPIHVTEEGEFTTKPVKNVESKIVWQEHAQFTPVDGETIVYYTAPCGLENEITTPQPAPPGLATTGSDIPVVPLAIGTGALVLGLIALGVHLTVRRRREASIDA